MSNTLKGLLVALALCVAPAAMATSIDISEFDGILNVAIGGPVVGFSGAIVAGETFDYQGIVLGGSQGTTTAVSTAFVGGTGMDLFHYTVTNVDGSGELGSLIASAVLQALPGSLGGGTGYVLSAFLTGGTYVLRMSGAVGTHYAGEISAVPLPGAALLFGSALFGAGLMGRKKLGARKVEAVAA